MKRLLFLPLLILVSVAEARTYYVSATGNDANAGTSASAAWKTLDKVNSFSFAANDTILLKRGEVFFGAVNIKRDNLTFSAYGTGAKPLITGLVNVTGWTSLGGGVYEASVTAAGKLNIVTLNGRPQQIGRYPNATDANDGYLTFEGAGSTSITDNQLSATVNWTGAEVAIRKNGWVIDRCQVTSQSGTTVNYKMGRNINAWNTPVLSPAKLNHGYFFMNDARTLDQFGEWHYDSTNKKLKMYFGTANPASYVVKASAVDVLFNIGTSKSGIVINNIAFEGGNLSGIYALSCDNITVQYCDIANIGAKAVHIFSTANVLVENVNTNNVLSNAIQVVSRTQQNVIVRNCVVKNTSPFAGMGSYYDDSDYKGIYLVVANNLVIDYNVVDSVGLAGIQFQGSDVMVRNNFVNYFCYRLHDNGGIYTYVGGTDAAPGATYTNRLIKNNIVMNGIGAATGTNSSLLDVAGIFMDGRTMNVEVLDNTVFNSAKDGIYSNNPKNISIRGNTLYNNKDDIGFTRYAWGSINNLVIKKNVSFPMSSSQHNIYYTNAGLNTPVTTTLEANLKSLGSIDSNYYNTFSDAGIVTEVYQTEGGALLPTSPFSLDGWKSFTGYDKATKRPAKKIEPFTINNTIGSNLFSNPQFTSNITGTTVFGTNVTATWDNTSKITGTGSLRINFSSPVANRYGLLHSPVGAISSAKKYVFRFNTLGTTNNGIVRVYMRKSASPYNNLVPLQTNSFGTSLKRHEFLFTAPISEAAASIVIEVEQNSGTTFIDNVEFFEANATTNTVESQVKFYYNETKVAKTIALDAKYIGVDSTVYNGSITLAPFTSKVIVKAGPVEGLPVAIAGADIVVTLPVDSVLLNGSATGGTIVSYTWTKIAGPAQFTLSNANSAKAKITNLAIGTYTFQLRVTSSTGLIASDTINIITAGVLPVTLVDFNAKNNDSKVMVKWSTNNELNSSHYEIERSFNGRNFESAGRVISNNSALQNTYSFTDNVLKSGVVYYRLAMVDKDGSINYSRILSVNIRSDKSFAVENVAIASGGVRMNVASGTQQTFSYAVVDVSGRVLVTKQLQLQPGSNNIVADIHSVSTGVYYVKMQCAGNTITRALVKE